MVPSTTKQHLHAVKEAERRLSGILKTARKLSVSPGDLAGLGAVQRLTAAGAGGRLVGRHVLPLVAGLITLLMVLVVYSVEEQGLGCLNHTSEPSESSHKESLSPSQTSSPPPPTATTNSVQGHSSRGEKDDPMPSPDRWPSSSDQLLQRRQR